MLQPRPSYSIPHLDVFTTVVQSFVLSKQGSQRPMTLIIGGRDLLFLGRDSFARFISHKARGSVPKK